MSNDNPHADALVHTARYHPSLPTQGFADLDEARRWAASFVHAYNRLHRRSTLRFVTPAQKYAREDRAILARNHCPERCVRNTTRNLTPRHHHHPQTH